MMRSALFARVSNHENNHPLPNFLFIIFVDAIFTTLFEQPFTNLFDVNAQNPAFPCV
jgi:hypothetical protein